MIRRIAWPLLALFGLLLSLASAASGLAAAVMLDAHAGIGALADCLGLNLIGRVSIEGLVGDYEAPEEHRRIMEAGSKLGIDPAKPDAERAYLTASPCDGMGNPNPPCPSPKRGPYGSYVWGENPVSRAVVESFLDEPVAAQVHREEMVRRALNQADKAHRELHQGVVYGVNGAPTMGTPAESPVPEQSVRYPAEEASDVPLHFPRYRMLDF